MAWGGMEFCGVVLRWRSAAGAVVSAVIVKTPVIPAGLYQACGARYRKVLSPSQEKRIAL